MIIVITHLEKHDLTGREEVVVSHGYDTITDKVVIMPQEPVRYIREAKFDQEIGEYVIV